MNPAHFHLLINHFPVIGMIIGTFILLFAVIQNSRPVLNTAYVLLSCVLIFSFMADISGENAEHYIEDEVEITDGRFDHERIEAHEDAASYAHFSAIITGLLAAIALAASSVLKINKRWIPVIVLLFAITSSALMANAAFTGGKIAHTEIHN